MKITTHPEANAAIISRIKDSKTTIYKLSKSVNIDRSNVRQMLTRDMQLSGFLAIVQALGGTVKIEWQPLTPVQAGT